MTRKPQQLDFEACGADLAGFAQHLANQPLRPDRPQEPCDAGLFGNDAAQIDLVDFINSKGK